MAAPVPNGGNESSRQGYVWAILVSAAGHVALVLLVLVILPLIFKGKTPPQAYTVKIVDSIPAGDLGTHLPRLGSERPQRKLPPPPPEVRHEEPKPQATPPPPENDKNAIALNTSPTPKPTVTPTPTPTPTPPPPPTPEPTPQPTPRPKKKHERKPTPVPTPTPEPKHTERRKPKAVPTPAIAKAEPTPNIKQKLEKVREHLLAEHLKDMKNKEAAEKNAAKTAGNGGPVLARTETPGKGMGVGPGTGSMGIQQDPGFLLYYQDVQEKIKKAWSFAGSNPDLNATVTFGINPDGSLNAVQVTSSSRDPAFDDSVVRAIRRAAPFAPPPEKYRPQFSAGIEAVFKLGDLTS